MSSDIADLRNLRGVIAELNRAEPRIGLQIRKIVFPLLYNSAIDAPAKIFLNDLEDFERALLKGSAAGQVEALRLSALSSLDKLTTSVAAAPQRSASISSLRN
ncbi:MAG: hypothetical protein H6882_08670 [Rhodobiaceae bacterium]|nr:hypothetical protein [Rhodobiaceae bacterium]